MVQRKGEGRSPKREEEMHPSGRRCKGCPRGRWKDEVRKNLEKRVVNWELLLLGERKAGVLEKLLGLANTQTQETGIERW